MTAPDRARLRGAVEQKDVYLVGADDWVLPGLLDALDEYEKALERCARWLEDKQDPPRYAAEIAREALARGVE